MDLAETVLQGSLLLAIPIAMAAGLVSFLSPCVLPLAPGYLAYVAGLTGADVNRSRTQRQPVPASTAPSGSGELIVDEGHLVVRTLRTLRPGRSRVSQRRGCVACDSLGGQAGESRGIEIPFFHLVVLK